MARIEMPDDIRNMTAEMRRNYDNPDPRPQLWRGNPNAVSSEETRAMLERIRREPLSREEIAKISSSKGGIIGKTAAFIDGALYGLEQVAPSGNVRGVRPLVPEKAEFKGSGRRPFFLGRDVPLDRAFRDFAEGGAGRGLNAPSMYAQPLDRRFHAAGGYRGQGIDQDVSVTYLMNPEMFIPGEKSLTLAFGKDAATGTSAAFASSNYLWNPPGGAFDLPEMQSIVRYIKDKREVLGELQKPYVHKFGFYDAVEDAANLLTAWNRYDAEHPTANDFLEMTKHDSSGNYGIANGLGIKRKRDLVRLLEGFKLDGLVEDDFDTVDTGFGGGTAVTPYVVSRVKRFFTADKSEAEKAGREEHNRRVKTYFSPDGMYGGFPYGDYPIEGVGKPSVGSPLPESIRHFVETSESNHPGTFAEYKHFGSIAPENIGKYVPGAIINIRKPFNSLSETSRTMIERLEESWKRQGIDFLRAYPKGWKEDGGDTVDPSVGYFPTVEEAQMLLAPRMAAKGGNAAGKSASSSVPSGHNHALDGYSGPRIVINPSTFRNNKDALCVAFDEAFRIITEMNGFDPVSEPTEKQRKFFSDTAYANDERMLRRTILARICTFDTSVSDPTDEQLQEAVEFLDTVMEIGAPQNEWEQRSVQRIRDAIAKTVGQPRAPEETPEPPAEGPRNAAAGGGEAEDERDLFGQNGTVETTDRDVADFVNSAVQGPDNFGAGGTVEITDRDVADFTGTADKRPENLMQKNGHYVDAQGRVISERAAKKLAEQNVRNGVEQPNVPPQQNVAQPQPQQNSLADDRTGIGGRKLTAGELAWQENRRRTTDEWRQRTGRTEDVFG